MKQVIVTMTIVFDVSSESDAQAVYDVSADIKDIEDQARGYADVRKIAIEVE